MRTKVTFDDLEKCITKPRLDPYFTALHKNINTTPQTYLLQQHLSGVVLNMLMLFEVTLRNQIDQFYQKQFNEDWMKLLLFKDSRNPLWDQQKQRLFEKTESTHLKLVELRSKFKTSHPGDIITHNDMVANITFGFWVSLFYRRQYISLGNNLLDIFIGLDNDKASRQWLANQLFLLKSVRNRVAHGKPIILHDQMIDFAILDQRIEMMIQLSTMLGAGQDLYEYELTDYNQTRAAILELC